MTILSQNHRNYSTCFPELSIDALPYVVRVPAKAMLFGEYGVLFGGVALAAVLPEQIFELQASLGHVCKRASFEDEAGLETAGKIVVEFHSELAGGRLQFSLADWSDSSFDSASAAVEKDAAVRLFLLRALAPLLPQITQVVARGYFLKLKVSRAFSPSLGLGSSSALIVSLYRAVEHLCSLSKRDAHTNQDKGLVKAWPVLYSMLKSAQGPGSGYDIAIQYAASLEPDTPSREECFEDAAKVTDRSSKRRQGRIFAFRKGAVPEQSCILSEVKASWFWKRAGFLIPSGQAAPTGSLLREALNGSRQQSREEPGGERCKERLEDFAAAHARIASEALEILENEGLWVKAAERHPFAELFQRSLDVARQQGIAGHLQAVHLPPEGILYKTMGAGMGDSIWCVPEYESGTGRAFPQLCKGVMLELK